METNIKTKLAILGGGPAGYIGALRAAQLGAEVVLIEGKYLGGVCMNVGCIPTKALLKTAEMLAGFKRAKEFGLAVNIEAVNWDVVVDRKDRVVKNLALGIDQLLKARGVTVINGFGKVLSANSTLVTTENGDVVVECEKLLLATGARPFIPAIAGIDADGVITSDDALGLKTLPKSLVVIGGGVIGVEFATMFAAAGVKVTVIEMADRLLPYEDAEVAAELLKIMKRQGIAFKLGTTVQEIKSDDAGLTLVYQTDGKMAKITCEKILVAAGRKTNLEAMEALNLKLENGHVWVDKHMQTSVPGVYAAGDLIGGKLLAHLAFAEGKTAVNNALGMESILNYNAVPACVYTNPEVASVGLTEAEAIAQGIKAKTGRFSFRHNGRALTLGEREGFVKIVADENNVIIGGQIMGATASEMISEITLAITLKATAEVLADMIHPHPSLSEAVWEAAADVVGKSLHKI